MDFKQISPLANLPLIIITLGDPAGIGPEIIVKLFHSRDFNSLGRILVVGDANRLRSAAAISCLDLRIHPILKVQEAVFLSRTIDVIDLQNVSKHLAWGCAMPDGGRAAVEYIRHAVDLAMQGEVDAIVTAPINKKAVALAGYNWPGHTELLAEYTQAEGAALMMLGERLRVSLVTLHVPLGEVVKVLTSKAIESTIRLTYQWLVRYVINVPKIAVTGLNPHCGDGGRFGDEEREIIMPAIEKVQNEKLQVSGPYPADALFGGGRALKFDAVVTMYHDQGLIPVKMEAMGKAVNVTLGIPILRTSVDHGTAYDIAGKGLASSQSLHAAVKTAVAFSQTGVTSHEET